MCGLNHAVIPVSELILRYNSSLYAINLSILFLTTQCLMYSNDCRESYCVTNNIMDFPLLLFINRTTGAVTLIYLFNSIL